MHKENLQAVIDAYMDRFEELNDLNGNDEGYKWRAASCFKEHWEIDAPDFGAMFKLAMSETSNLIDNAKVQPIGGILELLKHEDEVEGVRESFRDLFVEDDGDFDLRQKRLEAFANRINARIEHYHPNTWRYSQKLNNVLYYLNLWKPEDNYIYKYTEAEAWANCIEFGDDIGSGAAFSLRKYYRMCEELREVLAGCEELLKLHSVRAQREVRGYDDRLHILVYDLIYCAYAYNLYERVYIPKTPVGERIRRAQERSVRDKLLARIKAKEDELAEVTKRAVLLPDLTGSMLRHKAFGSGCVLECAEGKLLIEFPGGQKRFQYPQALAKGFLLCDDLDVMQQIAGAESFEQERMLVNRELSLLRDQLEKLNKA